MINASAEYIGTDEAITLFYTGIGNVLIDIGAFTKRKDGVVLLEETSNGGLSWQPFHAHKLGRGMRTNSCDSGPCQFRGALEGGGLESTYGLRVRCQNTPPWERIRVQITWAGGIGRHYLTGEPEYIIQVPDIWDLI